MEMKLIKQGAEARVFACQIFGRKSIAKERFPKLYRHTDLDDRLTKERTRAEIKGILKCKANGIKTPAIYFVDTKRSTIYMEQLENVDTVNVIIGNELKEHGSGAGDTTSDSAVQEPSDKLKALASEMGIMIGKMHSQGIIHGDLTTSNILVEKLSFDEGNPIISLIDFGLCHINSTAEDKGVDLYVLERAITSTHSSIPWFFEMVLASYKVANGKEGTEVVKRLDDIRLRGRKREMIG